MELERDKVLKEIRPVLSINTSGSGQIEKFQSEVLRPLLKFQNPMLLFWFRTYLKKKEPLFNAFTGLEQKKAILNLVKKEPYVRNALIPSIVGLFTTDELAFFMENRKEINKRIVAMLVQRFQDQIGRLV